MSMGIIGTLQEIIGIIGFIWGDRSIGIIKAVQSIIGVMGGAQVL
jgi:hypothetical protein